MSGLFVCVSVVQFFGLAWRAARKGEGARTHDWDVQLERYVLQKLEAIHVRHVHVAQHDVEVVPTLAQRRQRLRSPREGGDCEKRITRKEDKDKGESFLFYFIFHSARVCALRKMCI